MLNQNNIEKSLKLFLELSSIEKKLKERKDVIKENYLSNEAYQKLDNKSDLTLDLRSENIPTNILQKYIDYDLSNTNAKTINLITPTNKERKVIVLNEAVVMETIKNNYKTSFEYCPENYKEFFFEKKIGFHNEKTLIDLIMSDESILTPVLKKLIIDNVKTTIVTLDDPKEIKKLQKQIENEDKFFQTKTRIKENLSFIKSYYLNEADVKTDVELNYLFKFESFIDTQLEGKDLYIRKEEIMKEFQTLFNIEHLNIDIIKEFFKEYFILNKQDIEDINKIISEFGKIALFENEQMIYQLDDQVQNEVLNKLLNVKHIQNTEVLSYGINKYIALQKNEEVQKSVVINIFTGLDAVNKLKYALSPIEIYNDEKNKTRNNYHSIIHFLTAKGFQIDNEKYEKENELVITDTSKRQINKNLKELKNMIIDYYLMDAIGKRINEDYPVIEYQNKKILNLLSEQQIEEIKHDLSKKNNYVVKPEDVPELLHHDFLQAINEKNLKDTTIKQKICQDFSKIVPLKEGENFKILISQDGNNNEINISLNEIDQALRKKLIVKELTQQQKMDLSINH